MLTRREAVLAGAGAGALALSGGLINPGAIARADRRPLAREGVFEHGVASGFPRRRGGVLWTKLTGLDRTSRVPYEVATDPGFRKVVKRGTALARRKHDWNVSADVNGLKPSTQYYYRFSTGADESMVGRFRTALPADSRQPVRIGFFSCQNYRVGHFNAHAGLAAEDDLDLVLCLGDYIYEQEFFPFTVREDTTGDNGDADVQKLREYRQKYRLYQSDPDLQAMHAAHPFISVWDDHEIEENHAGRNPSSKADHDEETGGGRPRRIPYRQRRNNAYHAFFEAMPRKRRSGDANRIFGRAQLGSLVDLFALDCRQYRDPQPCDDRLAAPCPDQNTPGRKLLGNRQKRWLLDGLDNSDATWKLLGSSIMLMGFNNAPTVSFNVDGWDGYGAERREVIEHIQDRGIDNVASLVGDVHTFFAGRITETGSGENGTDTAVEYVGGSITTPSVGGTIGLPEEQFDLFAQNISNSSEHIDYANFEKRGYAVLEARPDELLVDFRAVDQITERGGSVSTLARFRTPAGSPEVQRIA